MATFQVKQRLQVVFTVQAETEQEASALLRKQIEGVATVEAYSAESQVKRIVNEATKLRPEVQNAKRQ